MIKDRIFITSTTVVVIIFLTVLGMRLPFLDTSLKPKPRPRAILNLFAKAAPSTFGSSKLDFFHSIDILPDSSEYNIPIATLTSLCDRYFTSPAGPNHIRPLQGRSPPPC